MNTDLLTLPTYSDNGLVQAVIEIPAGTNFKIEYNKETQEFKPDIKDGEDRIIDFLAYPANYGFIPSTYSNPKLGGDGDPIDVLVLGSAQEIGTVLEITPLAILRLMDAGEEDFKIIAIPVNSERPTMTAKSYTEFQDKYPGAKQIIETWFKNYNREDVSEVLGWGDEEEALQYIEQNIKR